LKKTNTEEDNEDEMRCGNDDFVIFVLENKKPKEK
jgi:hypothetical protein